jgi:hypothetical protein
VGADTASLARPSGVLEIGPGGAGPQDRPDAGLTLTVLYREHVLIISAPVFRTRAPSGDDHGSTVVGVLAKGKFTGLPGLRAPIASVAADPGGIAW